jgi:hypothetical protein
MRLSTMAVLGSVIGIIAVGLALSTATGTFAWTTPSLGAVTPGTTATPSSFGNWRRPGSRVAIP